MTLRAASQLMILSVLALPALRAQDTRAGFVTTLGRDTVAMESFTRSASRLEGDILVRVPGTVRFHYQLDLRTDGTVSHSVVDMDPVGVARYASRKVTLDFLGDSVRVATDSLGHRTQVMRKLEPKSVPFFMTGFESSYGLYSSLGILEMLVSSMPVSATDTLRVASTGIFTGTRTNRKLVRPSPTIAEVDYFMMVWTHMTTDALGHILTVDMSETTEKTRSVRTEYLDVPRAAKSFADRDRSGSGIGVASPSQTVKGSVGGSPIVVIYSRPRKRGREILGPVVAFDRVWRTGANEATVFVTDREVTIGGATIPAGFYSLWTLPTRTGVQLIINGQSGQWGTSYDVARDVARVPMRIAAASSPVEDFTITLPANGSAVELRMEWDTFVWTVPIVAK